MKIKSNTFLCGTQAGSKTSLYNQIMASYDAQTESGKLHLRHKKRRLRSKKRKRKKSKKKNGFHKTHKFSFSEPRNCHVTSWGPWGSCSKSCGIGESVSRIFMIPNLLPTHSNCSCFLPHLMGRCVREQCGRALGEGGRPAPP